MAVVGLGQLVFEWELDGERPKTRASRIRTHKYFLLGSTSMLLARERMGVGRGRIRVRDAARRNDMEGGRRRRWRGRPEDESRWSLTQAVRFDQHPVTGGLSPKLTVDGRTTYAKALAEGTRQGV